MPLENEEQLIHRFCETANPDLFSTLITGYVPQMRRVAFSILLHEADAMDAVQDATLRAFQNMDSLADPARFGGWLMRIVFGCSVDLLRSRKRNAGLDPAEPIADPTSPHAQPEDRLDACEWSAQLGTAIKSLHPRYRQPLILFHLDGLSIAEVAAHLAIPLGTARSLLSRARKQLSDMIPAHQREVPNLANDIFREQLSTQGLLSRSDHGKLHVMNGDAAANRLRASGLSDPMIVWTDLLHEGPQSIDASPSQRRKTRAAHLSSMGFGPAEQIEKRFEHADAELSNPGDGRERVLWFEHDLYDQLLLIRHLHWLSQHDPGACDSVSLICIGSFPGVERFIGLGQLEPDQIASLLETRMPIREEHLSLGRDVWVDYCSPDPASILRWLTSDTSALPYLHKAICRHLRQYPSAFNGLGLTEQFILESLQDGPLSAGAVFADGQKREASPFLGDAVVYHYIHRLAQEPTPAVEVSEEGRAVTAKTVVSLTDFGRRLLAGDADRIHTNGIDRWLGGVRLSSGAADWRWDESNQQLLQH